MNLPLGLDLLHAHDAWMLLLAPPVVAFGLWGVTRRRRALGTLSHPARMERLVPGFSALRAVARVALGGVVLLLLGFALLGPARGYTLRESISRGIDVVVCIDTSRSMLAEDLRPSRIERARREVRGFLDGLRGDRAALVAFAGDARDVAPLTHDTETLKGLLKQVAPIDNRVGGTDLAAALEHSLSLFDGRTGSHEAIVLVTDGEDLEGRALDVAREARERGIRVFVVGIGTATGGKIPVTLRDGRQGFLRGPDGEEVVSKLDGTTLARLAEETGGAYLSTEDVAAPLETLYHQNMSHLEGREVVGGQKRIPHDRFQWPLGLGLVCMIVEAGLREQRRVRR